MRHLYAFILLGLLACCAHEKRAVVTLKGMHDTIGGPQSEGSAEIEKLAKNKTDVFSSDFGFSTHPNDDFRKRDELLKKIIKLSPAKKIITLSYHQCRPDIEGPCFFDKGVSNHFFTDNEWKELLTKGSPLNLKWRKQMNELGQFLSVLQSQKVKIYLRPYHESNLPLFWWSNVDKPEYSKALWKMLHDYFQEELKLDNVYWVWSVSFHPKHINNLSSFYPGDDLVDVLAFDIYPPGKNKEPLFSEAWALLKKISKNRPLALSEVSKLPTKAELQIHPWMYVVPWGINMLKRDNSTQEITDFYKAE